MLRIQRHAEAGAVRLTLSGRIQGAHLAELEHAVAVETAAPLAPAAITLDLGEVRLVDRAAVAFLSRCEAGGIRLARCPAYVRVWIEKERRDR